MQERHAKYKAGEREQVEEDELPDADWQRAPFAAFLERVQGADQSLFKYDSHVT